MKALYIGYAKTGTKTMNAVFKTLGYKCYDFEENFFYLSKEWLEIIKNGSTVDDFKKMYSDVDVTLDTPVYFFWPQILEAFPDVKLLVHYREENSWLKSALNQCHAAANNRPFHVLSMLSPTAQRYAQFLRACANRKWGADRFAWPWQMLTGPNRTLMLNDYRQHNSYIKARAKEFGDQLHVVNLSEGWEPICRFLGEPVPDEPFPHENKGAEVLKKYMESSPVFAVMKREMKMSLAVIAVLLSIGVYFLLAFFFW